MAERHSLSPGPRGVLGLQLVFILLMWLDQTLPLLSARFLHQNSRTSQRRLQIWLSPFRTSTIKVIQICWNEPDAQLKTDSDPNPPNADFVKWCFGPQGADPTWAPCYSSCGCFHFIIHQKNSCCRFNHQNSTRLLLSLKLQSSFPPNSSSSTESNSSCLTFPLNSWITWWNVPTASSLKTASAADMNVGGGGGGGRSNTLRLHNTVLSGGAARRWAGRRPIRAATPRHNTSYTTRTRSGWHGGGGSVAPGGGGSAGEAFEVSAWEWSVVVITFKSLIRIWLRFHHLQVGKDDFNKS